MSRTSDLKIQFAEGTDQGQVRANNEDSLAAILALDPVTEKDKGNLFIVADGLGGLASGEVASRSAVEGVSNAWQDLKRFQSPSWLKETFLQVNDAIFTENQKRGREDIMATTLTVCLFHGNHLNIGHVGDCRVYRVRGGKIHCLTVDHAIDRYTLTRTIGAEPKVEVDVYELVPEKGDIYVQCSDGLYSMVPDEKILETVRDQGPEVGCQKLIELANAAGGQDNITVQVIHLK